MNKLPKVIANYFMSTVSTQQRYTNRSIPFSYSLELISSANCSSFTNKVKQNWSKNVIWLDESDLHTLRCSKHINEDTQQEKIKVSLVQDSETLPLHLNLFHELNHYRHHKMNFHTWDFITGAAKMNVRSGDPSKPVRIYKQGCLATNITTQMCNAEEELQLIGRTELDDHVVVYDFVNETWYRLEHSMEIRCAYNSDRVFECNEYSIPVGDYLTFILGACCR